MPFLIVGAILAILVYVPSYWVRHVMRKNGEEVGEIAGTGGELAQHLIRSGVIPFGMCSFKNLHATWESFPLRQTITIRT